MAKISKTAVDKALRDEVFSDLFGKPQNVSTPEFGRWNKVNDRQWGIILTDANGHDRYVRLGAIVAEERDDMTAEELMRSEIDAYNQKQADKAEKAEAKAKKIAKDKARREKEKEEKKNDVQ